MIWNPIQRYRIWRKLRDFTDTIRSNQATINNPMNGCPGDFREAYDKEELRILKELWSMGATDKQIGKAEYRGNMLAAKDFHELYETTQF